MKRNLGKVFIIILSLCNILAASTYEWSSKISKEDVVTNEAVFLHYTCTFSDKSELYVIEFNPVTDNENYTIKLLSEKEKIVDNHRVNSFEFVLFVKKGGDFSLNLEATMKKTNKDSIENTVLGRDNRSYEEYSIKKIPLKPVQLHVKDVDENLVGNFSLELRKDDQNVSAFEPYHLELIIKGEGNFETIKGFDFAIEGVKVFKEEPNLSVELTENGYKGVWSQKFAFVAQNDFSIPVKSLQYYNVKKKQDDTLTTKGLKVNVQKSVLKKEELLDKEEKSSFELKREYLYYLLTFLAGFILAKIKFKTKKREKRYNSQLCEKISQVKTLEQVGVLLVLEDPSKYKELIEKIEKKEFKNISEVKKLICR